MTQKKQLCFAAALAITTTLAALEPKLKPQIGPKKIALSLENKLTAKTTVTFYKGGPSSESDKNAGKGQKLNTVIVSPQDTKMLASDFSNNQTYLIKIGLAKGEIGYYFRYRGPKIVDNLVLTLKETNKQIILTPSFKGNLLKQVSIWTATEIPTWAQGKPTPSPTPPAQALKNVNLWLDDNVDKTDLMVHAYKEGSDVPYASFAYGEVYLKPTTIALSQGEGVYRLEAVKPGMTTATTTFNSADITGPTNIRLEMVNGALTFVMPPTAQALKHINLWIADNVDKSTLIVKAFKEGSGTPYATSTYNQDIYLVPTTVTLSEGEGMYRVEGSVTGMTTAVYTFNSAEVLQSPQTNLRLEVANGTLKFVKM